MAPQSHVTGHIFLDAASTNDRSKQREKKSEIEAACRRQFQHLKREFFFFLPSFSFIFIKCVLFFCFCFRKWKRLLTGREGTQIGKKLCRQQATK